MPVATSTVRRPWPATKLRRLRNNLCQVNQVEAKVVAVVAPAQAEAAAHRAAAEAVAEAAAAAAEEAAGAAVRPLKKAVSHTAKNT